MKLKYMVALLGVALVTTAFTVVLFAPGRVGATDEQPPGITPLIAQPKLTVNGCVFTLTTDKPAYAAGETPVLRIKADNPTDKPVTATVGVTMSGSSRPSPMSRVSPPAQLLWSRDWTVYLMPGETKSVTMETDTKLASGQMLFITLSNVDQSIVARTLIVRGSGQNTLRAAHAAAVIQPQPQE